MLSPSAIREKLGLKSHAEHEYDVFLTELPQRAEQTCWTKEQLVRARYRHTGRTTEMMIKALGSLSAGFSIVIVGHTYSHAHQIVTQMRRYGDKLGLKNLDAIRAETKEEAARHARAWSEDYSLVRMFTDHYIGGEE